MFLKVVTLTKLLSFCRYYLSTYLWMKYFDFWLKFLLSLFLLALLTISQHWFREWLGTKKATSYSLNHCWRLMATMSRQNGDLNTLRPRQNGRHFADDIFRCIFLNENVWIPIKISLKFVPKGRINNIPSLVQIMAWRRPGDKPLSEPMMVSSLTHICVTRPQWVKACVSYNVKCLTWFL